MEKDIKMSWVILFSIAAVVLVNAPLLYILIRIHNPSLLSQLWGYAPNQFLFPLLAFPVSAFATFAAMKFLITTLQQKTPFHPVIRWTTDNWLVVVLIGIVLSASICMVDYFFSAKTFDKLQPVYAERAITATKEIRNMFLALPKDSQAETRRTLIEQWREQKTEIVSRLEQSSDMQKDMLALNAGVYLQVVQDPALQRKLHLMNPPIQALNVMQLFISLLTAFCALFATILCIYVFKMDATAAQLPLLKKSLSAVFFALTFFAAFPILYAEQRGEIEYVVGTGYTMMPHVFSALIIIVLLSFIATLEPVKGNLPYLITTRLVPILIISVGFGLNFINSQPLRQLIGVDSNWGARILIIICCLLTWVFVILHLWPWKTDADNSPKAVISYKP